MTDTLEKLEEIKAYVRSLEIKIKQLKEDNVLLAQDNDRLRKLLNIPMSRP